MKSVLPTIIVLFFFISYMNTFIIYQNQSTDRTLEDFLMRILKNHLEKNVTKPKNNRSIVNFNTQIENVTCITEKYGYGYVGNKNVASDGTPCINWSRNVVLYRRYLMRKKNITSNYCRNPDGDIMGPWCFVERKNSFKQFKYKPCAIPFCKILEKNVKMGIVALNFRECPYGFKKYSEKVRKSFYNYCIVQPFILNRLPKGNYAFFLLGNPKKPECGSGFKIVTIRNKNYCLKNDNDTGTIDFPNYLHPKQGDLVFNMVLFKKDSCLTMLNHSSHFIILSKDFLNVTYCYYFYKLSSNGKSKNSIMGFFVTDESCPAGYTKESSINYFTTTQIYVYKTFKISVCYPKKKISSYPLGSYCLISILGACPTGFIPVTFKISSKSIVFCCRQSNKPIKNNQDLFTFYNISSMIAIDTNTKYCLNPPKDKSFQIMRYNIKTRYYVTQKTCKNCDLFQVFRPLTTRSRRWTFVISACHYNKLKNGFAYLTLNSRCPPGMEYSRITSKISTRLYSYQFKIKRYEFCSTTAMDNITFPSGSYCLYRIGSMCPLGFQPINTTPKTRSYIIGKSGEVPGISAFCCRNNSINSILTDTVTLPFITDSFQFGLPLPATKWSCLYGLVNHTAHNMEDYCQYFPVSINSTLSIVISDRSCPYTSSFDNQYRASYRKYQTMKFCSYRVTDEPPLGNYCIVFKTICPTNYFKQVTYYMINNLVLCCRLNQSNQNESQFQLADWIGSISRFTVLAYKHKCPVFSGYNHGAASRTYRNGFLARDIGVAHRANLTEMGVIIHSRRYSDFVVEFINCIYLKDPFNKSKTWPHGKYGLPKPLSGCPKDSFEEGSIEHFMETTQSSFSHSRLIHLDGNYMIGGSKLRWNFCVKSDVYRRVRLSMPFGRYCLFKIGSSCPYGFRSGSVTFVEITAMNKMFLIRNGTLPTIETNGPFITYHFCCKSGRGDVQHEPMHLPVETGPFYLLRYGSFCQPVWHMKATEEFICIDSEDSNQYLNYSFSAPYRVEGFTPVTGSYVRGCDFQINLCYYEKYNTAPKPNKTIVPEFLNWPSGSYTFLKKKASKCPEEFLEGEVSLESLSVYPQFMKALVFPTVQHYKEDSKESSKLIMSYCKRNKNYTGSEEFEVWPQGNYCFFFEDKCPEDLLYFKAQMFDSKFLVHIKGVPMKDFGRLCCKQNLLSNITDLTHFPGEHYSTIIYPSLTVRACPPHLQMRVATVDLLKEILCFYERIDKPEETEEDVTSQFPPGNYLIPAASNSLINQTCPPDLFQKVIHKHVTSSNNDELEPLLLEFCAKTGSKKRKTKTKFPRGNYCILTMEETCPSTQFNYETMLTIPNYRYYQSENDKGIVIHKQMGHRFSHYLACCQSDPTHLVSNAEVPNYKSQIPLLLFSFNKICSYIDGITNVHVITRPTPLRIRGYVSQSSVMDGYQMSPLDQAEGDQLKICLYDQKSLWDIESRCNCHEFANCSYTLVDIKCTCKSSYFGDGVNVCKKITNSTDPCGNACPEFKSKCGFNKVLGQYQCRCLPGYKGNGIKCKPSCETRYCNPFSVCIVDMYESFCKCKDEAIEGENNECIGDFVNSLAHLSGFPTALYGLNLSCFDTKTYRHLIDPNPSLTLVMIIPSDRKVFSNCTNVKNFYSIQSIPDLQLDLPYQTTISTYSGSQVHLAKDENNQWLINDVIRVNYSVVFTNAIGLILDQSFNSSTSLDVKASKLTSHRSTVAGIVISLLLLLICCFVLGFCIFRYRVGYRFRRLYETRSESNMHFISETNQVQIGT